MDDKKNNKMDDKKIFPFVNLVQICKTYERWIQRIARTEVSGETPVPIKPQSAQQIYEFSKILTRYSKDPLYAFYFKGTIPDYLSRLICQSPETEFLIDVHELNKQNILLNCLGSNLSHKKLTINGDVGDYVGGSSDSSVIIINGNAGKNVGDMSLECEIRIKGEYKSLADYVNEGQTEVYQWKGEEWKKVSP